MRPQRVHDAHATPYDVVIPCFNRATVIARAVESVLAQTHQPSRLILVDDGSTDDTAAVLLELEASDDRIHSVLLPRNMGVSGARNVGLAFARSEWVAFLDSDDVWLPFAAVKLVAETAAGKVDVVVGHFQRSWPDGIIDPPECGWDGGDIRKALMQAGAIGPSWSIIRRSLAQRLGGFDPSFHNCNDWEFYTRAAASGASFRRIDSAIALYTYSDSGRLSHDKAQQQDNAARVLAHPYLRAERSAA